MPLSPLTALSPLDGRYAAGVDPLRHCLSELALMRHRVRVEVEWLIALAAEDGIEDIAPLTPQTAAMLRSLAEGFGEADGARVKALERQTNHDVKAIEYWLRERVAHDQVLARATGFIHFA